MRKGGVLHEGRRAQLLALAVRGAEGLAVDSGSSAACITIHAISSSRGSSATSRKTFFGSGAVDVDLRRGELLEDRLLPAGVHPPDLLVEPRVDVALAEPPCARPSRPAGGSCRASGSSSFRRPSGTRRAADREDVAGLIRRARNRFLIHGQHWTTDTGRPVLGQRRISNHAPRELPGACPYEKTEVWHVEEDEMDPDCRRSRRPHGRRRRFRVPGQGQDQGAEQPPFRLGKVQAEDLQVSVREVGVVDPETKVDVMAVSGGSCPQGA